MNKLQLLVADMATTHRNKVIQWTPALRKFFGIKEGVGRTVLPDEPPSDFNQWIKGIHQQLK